VELVADHVGRWGTGVSAPSWSVRLPAWTGVARVRHAWRLLADDTYRRERQREDPWHVLYAAAREEWEREQQAAGAAAPAASYEPAPAALAA
jgi:hypothetical protein